jgi:hypothetical protein
LYTEAVLINRKNIRSLIASQLLNGEQIKCSVLLVTAHLYIFDHPLTFRAFWCIAQVITLWSALVEDFLYSLT